MNKKKDFLNDNCNDNYLLHNSIFFDEETKSESQSNNNHYFDLSDSLRPDLRDDGNKNVLGKFKDEMNSLLINEFTALNPKVYSTIHEHFDKDKKTNN